jgi:hypothetical protein
MSTNFEKLERQARALSPKEKAELARILIEDLDAAVDADAEKLWLEEAQHRYDAYCARELPAHSGDDVMSRVRKRLK